MRLTDTPPRRPAPVAAGTGARARRARAWRPLLRSGCLFAALATLVTGCAFTRGNVSAPIQRGAVEQIQTGATTRSEVVALLGAPDRIVRANDQDVLHYYYYDIKSSSLLLILVNFSRAQVASDDLFVFVNRDGLVTDVLFGRRTDGLEFRFWPFGD